MHELVCGRINRLHSIHIGVLPMKNFEKPSDLFTKRGYPKHEPVDKEADLATDKVEIAPDDGIVKEFLPVEKPWSDLDGVGGVPLEQVDKL